MTRSLDQLIDASYALVIDERFDGPALERSRWFPHHLPHWSSSAASAARYQLTTEGLELRIDVDQEPWCPEFDASTRVSALMTGRSSGPAGSTQGLHRFSPAAVVREPQPTEHLLAPHYGVIAISAAAPDLDEHSMVALWMIGTEEVPERSGVVDVFEIFGRDLTPDGAKVGMSLKAFNDPRLTDDVAAVEAAIDVRKPHEYAVEWTPDQLVFFIDGEPVRSVEQSPDYPMLFVLGVYDFDQTPGRDRPGLPQRLIVNRVRTYTRKSR